MILCCGEAPIDFSPLDQSGAFQTYNGGSIYNAAIALGRLGQWDAPLQEEMSR